ncbi:MULTISPECIES: aspartate 1-decarboxylase [Acinetobacter]|jgi:aspartate 1-decarboxylase|uniref:aspartate 1-decarboxylase n=1 Tax=Acinetobacter TaxID=469 RepID=UPI00103C93CD|nr:aspartate 1-decarboxylase [Acinetobacter sp. ANC 3781]TCB80308.1 aspartate 1-decarboxylase [Acinetobacter sp. ANC 3781]
MLSRLLKCKIHRAQVTHAELHYEGSCAIDGVLMDLAGIREYEEIHVWNVTNGKRFATYAIRGEDHSGIISVNGGAAHQADVGDLVIIATFGDFTEAEANAHKPRLVYANPNNTVSHTANCIPVQVA